MTEEKRTRVSVDINEMLHTRMRELSKRKGVNIGRLYDEALSTYVQQTDNYLGANFESKRKETSDNGN